ncbi:MAG: hypothetical protein ABW175_22320 [Bradyrhizobium sp.]
MEVNMAKNRFEQVDEFQPDAINLKLVRKDSGEVAIVHCPRSAAPDQLPADLTTQEMQIREAVIGAIQLANAKKLPIVVIDPDHLWTGEWGELWRYEARDD